MIKFSGYIEGIDDDDIQSIVESLVAIVEAAGGTMFSVWDKCDDEGCVSPPAPLGADAEHA